MYLIYLKGNKRKIVDDAYHGKVHWKRSDVEILSQRI